MEELVFDQKVVLVCEDCGTKSDAKTRDALVEDGWNWQEFEIKNSEIERVAFCSDCFSSEKYAVAVWRTERWLKESSVNSEDKTGDSN